MTADFRAAPLLGNAHVQTLLGLWLKRGRLPGRTRRWLAPLPDGDTLALHDNTPSTWKPGDPVTVVVHGLTGSHRSAGVVMLADRVARRGARTFRVDLRGAGASFALCRKLYTAGCSADLRVALTRVHEIAPGSPIWLVGTSLGGNVALKLAGESATQPVPGLAAVAVLNPPVDLAACTALIAHKRNRLYEKHFVAELVRDVCRSARHWGEPLPAVDARMSLKGFDDAYTAPRNGYHDADHYYAMNSSHELAGHSPVPTLILTARDDPFVDWRPIESLRGRLDVRITERGGHTGFVGWTTWWAEEQIAAWLATSHIA
ncbi:MAG: alpha/beta fold hydrolase [Gemmataceae bacterium]|nr:alpha/beta fold hydrolase [Gemmataceae bacterium]